MIYHYCRWDEPGANSSMCRAVCGQLINPKHEHAAEPTCPDCAKWVREYEALDFGQNDSEPVAAQRATKE